MKKEKTLADKIIFIDDLLHSTFSKKTYLYFIDIIEHLNSLQSSNDNLIEQCINKDQEIERLNEENKKYNKWIESLNKDNHRLNNIIKQIYEIFKNGRFEDDCDCIQIEELITRELKGVDKE